MAENDNTLRQADAYIDVEGILAEKNLEFTTDKNGAEIVQGSLTLKIDSTHEVELRVYASKVTNKGTANPAYNSMTTVNEQYHSIAEVGLQEASRVRCKQGQIRLNMYVGRDGEIHSGYSFNASFLNRVSETEKDPYVPHAKFEVEGYVRAVFDEVNREGEPTGRMKISLLVPTYNSIEPLEIVVPEKYAEGIADMYTSGDTGKFYGIIDNTVEVRKETIHMAIGDDVVKTSEYRHMELCLTGAIEPYGEDTNTPRPYSSDAIRKAQADRELHANDLKAQQAAKNGKPGVAANQSATGRPLPKFVM